MTKSTITTFLAGGGGLLATWLAVTPPATIPAGSNPADTPPGAVRAVTVDDLNLEEATLRAHLSSMPLRPSARNPFRFGRAAASVSPPVYIEAEAPVAPLVVPPPSLSLSGIFTETGKRTAIVTGGGQLYLVTEGDLVAGGYHVVAVESDAVTLRDAAGTDTRLVLH
jgi:hypothetical protein